ncbi:MAG: hypothetical protein M0Z79_02480 [Nitrospiraceae bacterium]|nr:hypothetical protein [Nitrospiraceae bacterium]
MKKIALFLAVVMVAVVALQSEAAMGGNPMMGPGGGTMMTNTGGFGMMNGMGGTPIVADDGTAYVVIHNPSTSPGTVPSSASFESKINQIKPTGQIDTLTLKGIVSRPVVYGGMFIATASLPDMSNFNMIGNLGSAPVARQATLYAVPVPFTSASSPVAVSLDGNYASVPVIANNKIYVVTTDFGNAMMSGNTMFNGMYGTYNFNTTTAHSYLYIVNFDGTLASKITIQ